MSDRLDGSFSGLWVCELCGRTGVECACEHFSRGTGAWETPWGTHGGFSDAEVAAEFWHQRSLFGAAARGWTDKNNTAQEAAYYQARDRMFLWERMARGCHAHMMDYADGFLSPGGASRFEELD